MGENISKLTPEDCEAQFGISYLNLLKLQKYNRELLKDHSIPNEIYAKLITLDAALEGTFKLLN